MKLFHKSINGKIKSLEKKLKKLNDDLSNRLSNSMADVTTAITMQVNLKHIVVDHNALCRINPETGELCDYLVHFLEYDDIAKIKYYLDAYLTTNEDVLEQKDIAKLSYLINLLP